MSGYSDVRAVTITADTVALDADGISVAASVGNNAALTIGGALASGGAVALSHGRIVTILSAGNDAAISFTVTGTDVNGDAQTESITGATLGVTVVDMAASAYGWFAVSGPATVLTSGTLVVGNHAVPLGAVGAVGPAAGDVIQVIGVVMIVNVTTDYSLINLTGII